MKAILVLDEMPNDCADCPLEYDCMTCRAINKSILLEDFSKRPNWCPLKELPKREPDDQIGQVKLAEKEHLPVDWTQAFCIGWNACLDAIE